ncbi:MAG: septum formation initiator family protein [Actinomycetaceae bacterium]|nr:septum formation initiator family protein [Arcanobacterium sp.]MDD7687423.1 septum formation initiator family protein [Actinomycetaceae bacterium]MDY5272897.1 septum formation initiator family protein [Arcanobacterium sp.]
MSVRRPPQPHVHHDGHDGVRAPAVDASAAHQRGERRGRPEGRGVERGRVERGAWAARRRGGQPRVSKAAEEREAAAAQSYSRPGQSHTDYSRPEQNYAHTAEHTGAHGRTDWRIMWEGQKKSHQISLRMLAILAFAAIAVLIVMTPLRAFITQQEQLRSLNDELAARREHISELNDAIALWNDPQYVQSQARQRLGYVMPGQTLYYVTGKQAQSAASGEQRIAQANKERRAATPFYMTMWDSIVIAGQVGSAQNPQGVPVISGDAPAADKADTDADKAPATDKASTSADKESGSGN